MSNHVFDAPNRVDAPIPAYKVVALEGPFKKTLKRLDPTTKELVDQEITIPRGFMIEFPRGHSIFVEKLSDFDALGYSEIIPVIKQHLEGEMNSEIDQPGVKRKIHTPDDEDE